MCDCRCYVVPPHLLRSISDSTHNPQTVRNAARDALSRQAAVNTCRHERSKAIAKGQGRGRIRERVLWGRVRKPKVPGTPSIAGVDLLRHISQSNTVDERVRERANKDLERVADVHKRTAAAQKQKGMFIFPCILGTGLHV